ncbi:MAG: Tad domain-containing protein [Nitratireductor sp.]|nr:Tad domain-containing protein [Nitratireductor sp.]
MATGLLRKFLRDRRGNFAFTFALTSLPILFSAGLALDYSMIQLERWELQATADSSAFYAVKELEKAGKTESDLLKDAGDVVESNFTIPGAVEVNLDTEVNLLSVRLTKQYQPTFLALIHPDPLTIGVVAEVTYNEVYTGAKCFVSLSETGKGVFNLNGNAVIDAPTCGVQVNSNSPDAVDLNGSGTEITAQSNCFVGGVQSGLSRIRPQPMDECPVLPDPFDEYALPSVGSCDHYDFKINANASATMRDGVYCGGIDIGSGANVTFEPGLYVIKNGVFKTTGSAMLNGDGVSFFFTGNDIAVNFSGGTTYRFVAMDDGPIAGFIFFFDPDGDTSKASAISGNSSTYFEGILYFGRRDLTVNGEGTVNTNSPFSVLFANTITLNGNADIHLKVDTKYKDLPVPEELYTKAISPRLVK